MRLTDSLVFFFTFLFSFPVTLGKEKHFRTSWQGTHYYATVHDIQLSTRYLEFTVMKDGKVRLTKDIKTDEMLSQDLVFDPDKVISSMFLYSAIAEKRVETVGDPVKESELNWIPIMLSEFPSEKRKDSAQPKVKTTDVLKVMYNFPMTYPVEILLSRSDENTGSQILSSPTTGTFLVFGDNSTLASKITDDILRFQEFQQVLKIRETLDWSEVKGEVGTVQIFLRMGETYFNESEACKGWRRFVVSKDEQFITNGFTQFFGTVHDNTINFHITGDVAVPAVIDEISRKITIQTSASPVGSSTANGTNWKQLLEKRLKSSGGSPSDKKFLVRRTLVSENEDGNIYYEMTCTDMFISIVGAQKLGNLVCAKNSKTIEIPYSFK